MTTSFQHRLGALSAAGSAGIFQGALRGVEKESLRITPAGLIAQTGHPRAFGSALTNRYITTDYSEALLEFVTPAEPSNWAPLQFLCDIHQFVYQGLDDELLWPFSMPCRLRGQEDIPLARFGTSNIGRMKTIYRRGLGYRYGRYMQVISGVHFNYSLPERFWATYQQIEGDQQDAQAFRSAAYLAMVRNVRRLDWLLLYLFGASPLACRSFLDGQETDLELVDKGTYSGPYATSLRMSDIGYRNRNQATLRVSANSLEEYIADLTRAISLPHAEYEAIGIKVDGELRQLNANALQIENEYYSTVRPKRVARSGERPTSALRRGGVEYVELRALDISPFDPIGMNQNQARFLETFLVYCLLLDSPPISADEESEIESNHSAVATRGRHPDLQLRRGGKAISRRDWARELCADMLGVAGILEASGENGYVDAVCQQAEMTNHEEMTPSARLATAVKDSGLSFAAYGLQVAESYRDYFGALAAEHNRHRAQLIDESRESLQSQLEIEAADSQSFDEFLAAYFQN